MKIKKSTILEHLDMFLLCANCATVNFQENKHCTICGYQELYRNDKGVKQLITARDEDIIYA